MTTQHRPDSRPPADRDGEATSPFDAALVMEGYPQDEREDAAIERVLAASKKEQASSAHR